MELLLLAIIWGIAGFVHGISGFGGTILAVTLLSLFLPLQFVVPLGIMTSLGMNLVVMYKYRKECEYKILGFMLLAACPGIALGAYTLTFIPNAYIQFAMGIFLLLFIGWQYTHKKGKRGQDTLWKRILASFASGFAIASTSLGGPPMAIYVLHAAWSPQKILGTTGFFFFLIGLFSLPGLVFANLFSAILLKYAFVSTICAALGIRLSFHFIKKGEMDFFVRSLLLVIFVSAILCLYSSGSEIFSFNIF